jgi:CRP/FNR family transcriptional regulator, cyclic AMP receptor protein
MKVRGVFQDSTETREVPTDSVIFQTGDEGEEMFGVIAGKVELRLDNGRVIELGPDDCFGEMALVDHSPRSATAVATEPTTLAVIDYRRFLWLVHETPTFALQVMSRMADHLRHDG